MRGEGGGLLFQSKNVTLNRGASLLASCVFVQISDGQSSSHSSPKYLKVPTFDNCFRRFVGHYFRETKFICVLYYIKFQRPFQVICSLCNFFVFSLYHVKTLNSENI